MIIQILILAYLIQLFYIGYVKLFGDPISDKAFLVWMFPFVAPLVYVIGEFTGYFDDDNDTGFA
jgi:hypothetical protein